MERVRIAREIIRMDVTLVRHGKLGPIYAAVIKNVKLCQSYQPMLNGARKALECGLVRGVDKIAMYCADEKEPRLIGSAAHCAKLTVDEDDTCRFGKYEMWTKGKHTDQPSRMS